MNHRAFHLALAGLAACGTSASTAHDGGAPRTDATSRDARPTHEASAASGPALPVLPVGHSGRWLTDALGRVLLVHGVNMVNKLPPYTPSGAGFSDADAAWLAASGFRIVRVGVLGTGLMPTPGVVDASYVASIVATVKSLASHDVLSLIDLHQDGWGPTVGSDGCPGWMTLTGDAGATDAGFPAYYLSDPAVQQAFQSFWDDATGPGDAGLEEDYAAMFSALAAALASEPTVLGYDLFNEPWPGTTWQPCLSNANGCPSLDQAELAPAYAKAVTAIRLAGDSHLVLGEPFSLFNFGVSTTSIPVPGMDSNAGMAFHVYPLAASGAAAVIQNAVAWADASGGALLNTEWGASTDTDTLVTESTALDSALVPWIFWTFYNQAVGATPSPGVVTSLDAAPGDASLVPTTVAALVQAYPLAVAGTPTTLVVDPTARTMSFTWSTARAGGGSFPAGTVSTFEAPELTYPGGYTVTVTGGTVTSTACAPLLTVASSPAASRVTVKVTPGSCSH